MRKTLRRATVVFILSIALLCIWSLLTYNLNSNSAKASSAVFSISSTIANPGKDAEVTFSLGENSNICSFQLQFIYDESLLELVRADINKLVGNTFAINTSTAGLITLNYSQTENFTAKADFVTLVFRVKAAKLGSSISLELSNGYDNSAFTSVIGNICEVENLTYNLGHIKVGLVGDVNQDDIIDCDDVLAIQLHLTGKTIIKPTSLVFADVNGDGIVRIDDATRLQMFLLRKIDSLVPDDYLEKIDSAFANLYSANSFKAVTSKRENSGEEQSSYMEMSYLNTASGYDARLDLDGELLFLLHDSTAYYNNGNSYTIVPNFEKANTISLLTANDLHSQYNLAAVLLSDISLRNCFTISKSENGYIARAITENIIDLIWKNYNTNIDKIVASKPELAGITKDYFNFLNQINLKVTLQIAENIPKSIKVDLFVPQYVYNQLGSDKASSTYVYNIVIRQNSVTSIEKPINLPTVPDESKEEKERKTINDFKAKLTTDANKFSLDIEKNSAVSIENATIIDVVILTLEETPLASYEIIKSSTQTRSMSQITNTVVLWSFSPQKSQELFRIDSAVSVTIDSRSGLSVSNSINVELQQSNGTSGNCVIKIVPLTLKQELLNVIANTAKLSKYKLSLPNNQEIVVDKSNSPYAKFVDMSTVIGLSNNTLYYTNLMPKKTRRTATLTDFLDITHNIESVLGDTVTDIVDVYRNENGFTADRKGGRKSVFNVADGKVTQIITSESLSSLTQTITISEEIGARTTFLDKNYSLATFRNIEIDINGALDNNGALPRREFEVLMPITNLPTPSVSGKTFYGWGIDGKVPDLASKLIVAEDTTKLTAFFYETADFEQQKGDLLKIKSFLDDTKAFQSYGSIFSSINSTSMSPYHSSMNRGSSKPSVFSQVTHRANDIASFFYEIINGGKHYYLDKVGDDILRKSQEECAHDIDIFSLASNVIDKGELVGKSGNSYALTHNSQLIIITAPQGTVTGIIFISSKSELGKPSTLTTAYPLIEYTDVDHSELMDPILANFLRL